MDRIMCGFGRGGGRSRVAHHYPGQDGVRAGDRFHGDFTVAASNLVWVADFTYVYTWVVANMKTTAVMTKALNMSVARHDPYERPIEPGPIHYGYAGSKHTPVKFAEPIALQQLSAPSGPLAMPMAAPLLDRSSACSRPRS
ncbi:hypothetical protein AB0L82_36325 [Nocardia sp. NPDC052001]|uniref:hypothetical protein n=1 Tax=Nocardia sp. NPDC052001 TaxID=3154853 RepID=UPI00344153B8